MDLIPTPDQVVAAAGNVAHTVLYGGLADLRPMPRTLIDDGELREVYHYRPSADVRRDRRPGPAGHPPGRSGAVLRPAPRLLPGRAPGVAGPPDLPRGVRPGVVQEPGPRRGALGRRGAARGRSGPSTSTPAVAACTWSGWSLGGIFALLVAADRQDLPIASLTVVGSPVDVTKVPLVAPVRPLLNLTQGPGAITRAYRALGGVPQPLVNWAFTAASAQKVLTKPLAVLTHLDDTDYLAQLEAVDRFRANMIAYPGRTFGQLYHRFVKGNTLSVGRMEIGDRTVDLAADRGAGAGLRRQHRRHRAAAGRTRGGAAADRGARGALRGRAGRAPRHAHRPGRARHHVGGARRVGRAVVDRRAGREGAGRRPRPGRPRPRRPRPRRLPRRRPRRRRPLQEGRKKASRPTRSGPTPRGATARRARARWASGDDGARRGATAPRRTRRLRQRLGRDRRLRHGARA